MKKILVDGGKGVGKSTLIQRIIHKADFSESTGLLNWYRALRYDHFDSVIFIVDLSNRESVMYLYKTVPLLTSYVYKYTSLLLIGNKKQYKKVSDNTIHYLISTFLEKEFSSVTYRELDLQNDSDTTIFDAIEIN